jgi:hypothetical protein
MESGPEKNFKSSALRKGLTLAISLGLSLGIWTLDGMTNANFGFSIFYLPAVLLTAWELGWLWSIAVALACAGLWLETETSMERFYLHPLVPYWNALVRLGFFLASGYLLHRLKLEHERRASLILQLQEAMAKIKTLRGLVPICAWCKKIRDDKGFWSQVESYVEQHSEAQFTHGICPDCLKKVEEEESGEKSSG